MANNSLRREVGVLPLLLTGLGSIIGSGWLFGSANAAQHAGPGAVWSWIIGAAIVTTIALSYAELGAMLPESGGMVRYSHHSHGSLIGFISGWANWIAIVSVIPVEAEASVQYMASWSWQWAANLYVDTGHGHGELTLTGLLIAAVLVLVYFFLNFWGVKLFARSNSVITLFKLIVPGATGLALIASGFHQENFQVGLTGEQFVTDWAGILTAVSVSGIVFSFNGFQSPINLAGEARNPDRSIPIAVLGSIALATVIYLLLQVAYVGAVPTELLKKAGWSGINFRSPFAELAILVNLNWLAILLYADAFVSPSGTGITYTATTARMIYGMEKNKTLPPILGVIDSRRGVPRNAMYFNLLVSYLFLFFFRGWDTLAAVISAATTISYMTGPVSVMSLRRTAPQLHRPLKIPGLPIISAAAFVLATEILYWSRWPMTFHIIGLMLVALPIYFYYQIKQGWPNFGQQLRAAVWMILYLPTIALISWAGSPLFGGKGYLPNGVDLIIVAVVGLLFFYWGVCSGWQTESLQPPCQQKG